MEHGHCRRIVHGAALALALIGSAALAPARAQSERSEIDALWKDPAFQKAFVAGYGFDAEIEPRVTQDELELLEELRPLMANDLPGAARMLQKKMKSMKSDGSALLDFTLGGIFFQQGETEQALQHTRAAVDKYPSFRRAWRNLGLISFQAGKNDEAIQAFTRMIELGGHDGYAYGLLGAAYAAKGDFQPAEGAYRNALLLQPERIEWRLGLTRSVLRQEKYEDAATLLDALIEMHPDKAEFWLLQGRAYLDMKQPLRAAENFEIVDRLGKSTVDTLNTLGDIYSTESLFDLAARAYVRAVDLDPAQPVARALRSAEILSSRGAVEQAALVTGRIKSVLSAQIQDADRKTLLKLEARLAMANGSSSPEAVAALEETLQIDPLDGDALMLLAQHYERQNEPDRAIFYYERAESVPAVEANARVRHAQVLVRMERFGDALPLLRQAQDLRPREDVARYIEQVERISRSRK
jgi:tetratricopeptide (TPR) repeat protein